MYKKILLMCLMVVACKSSTVVNDTQTSSNQPSVESEHEIVTEVTSKKENEVSPEAMKTIVSYLASDALEGRDTGSEGIDKAATYISDYFKTNGVGPYYCKYRDVFDVDGKEAFNVIGLLQGTDPVLQDEYVVIGAHYDHIGKGKQVGDDVIANGANDNAAGTAAVMQMAKYFSKVKSNESFHIKMTKADIDWNPTTFGFDLDASQNGTLVKFSHINWQERNKNASTYFMVKRVCRCGDVGR